MSKARQKLGDIVMFHVTSDPSSKVWMGKEDPEALSVRKAKPHEIKNEPVYYGKASEGQLFYAFQTFLGRSHGGTGKAGSTPEWVKYSWFFLINRNGQRIMIADMAKFYTFLYQQKMLPIINALLHHIWFDITSCHDKTTWPYDTKVNNLRQWLTRIF